MQEQDIVSDDLISILNTTESIVSKKRTIWDRHSHVPHLIRVGV